MPKSRSLSIYLLRENITEPNNALKTLNGVRRVELQIDRSVGVLYYRRRPAAPPAWVSFFSPHIAANDFRTSSVSAVFIISAGQRLFALTFGQGRHLLALEAYEDNFGLTTTLNSVSPDQIRTVDRQTLDATGRLSHEQATRNISILEFGLDIDKDLLRAVSGPPQPATLARRFAGADALSVLATIDLATLQAKLREYLTQYRKTDYRERFPWVENIKPVTDRNVISQFDAELIDQLQDHIPDRVWLAVPDLVDWDDVEGFTYSKTANEDLHDDISFATYLNDTGRDLPGLTLDVLRGDRVYCISSESQAPKAEWQIYKCIYGELENNGETYLLNAGKWYKVKREFLEDIDNELARIHPSVILGPPAFQHDDEYHYNQSFCNNEPATYALMDRRTISYGGGSSRVEFCDVYSTRREMMHVKRYGGSGTLSHLFAQGVVSASLLLNDRQFRQEVNDTLPETHKLANPVEPIRSAEFEVAYVITGPPRTLPVFSRITLRSSFRQLTNMGFRVTVTPVPAA
jgi:uncharacterized protein (TIGR04141 family)